MTRFPNIKKSVKKTWHSRVFWKNFEVFRKIKVFDISSLKSVLKGRKGITRNLC